HRLRKAFPNLISRDGVRHDVLPPVNSPWSVGKLSADGGKNLQTVMPVAGRFIFNRSLHNRRLC
ncbi:MAG: hypothetical protein E7G14_10080, partial [Klebsiella michiganensis]|nr:hypothetical protein [Klebsiella michiganensis]